MKAGSRRVGWRRMGVTLVFLTFMAISTASTPVNALGACANDAFRENLASKNLPDCRAYEQVTPVDKNGNNAGGTDYQMRAAADGQAFKYYSSVPMPAGRGPSYVASRSDSNWSSFWLGSTLTLEPSGWTEDLSSSFGIFGLAAAREFQRAGTFDGSAEKILPPGADTLSFLSGNGAFVGGSADNSKLFFQIRNRFQVWDRDTKILKLVDQLPDAFCGSPPCEPAAGSFGGAYDWWKSNLSELAPYPRTYAQEQHVVSIDGSRAFFTTREDGQLFLRENPTDVSAETIHVSASKKTNGSGSGGADASGPQPAALMSAIPDGSKVFFTSSEELTNDENTGAEAIGRANSEGAGVDHNFIPVGAKGIAMDATHIYWTLPQQNTIGRANLDGSGVNQAFITDATNPQDVAVDSSFVYWTNRGTGSIARANLDGTGVNQSFVENAGDSQGIDVNSTHIFWAIPGFGTIARAKLDGTDAEPFFIEASSFFSGKDPHGVTVNDTHVFWTDPATGSIGRSTVAGTEIDKEFITGITGPQGISASNAKILWATSNSLSSSAMIGVATTDKSVISRNFISSFRSSDVDFDSSNVLWSADLSPLNSRGKDLYRYDTEAGELIDISTDSSAFEGAEVKGVIGVSDDGSKAYFVANGNLDGVGGAAPGDCAGDPGEAGTFGFTGTCNLYLWKEDETADGDVTSIARLDVSGPIPLSDALNWKPRAFASSFESAAETTAAGRVSGNGDLLFRSQNQLTSAADGGIPQFYHYDADDDRLTCVSCGLMGAPTARPTLSSLAVLVGSSPFQFLERSLSDDGTRVFFESSDKLIPQDVNGDDGCPLVLIAGAKNYPSCQDVYMWEARGAGSCEDSAVKGCLYLLSTGTDSAPSFLGDASVSGDDVFIYTDQQLVKQDEDSLTDVYDARVGGGLASQYPPEPKICNSRQNCVPPSPPAPQTNQPTTLSGSGDPRRPKSKRCPKGKRKVRTKGRTRCIKKSKRSRHRSQANTNGRASR